MRDEKGRTLLYVIIIRDIFNNTKKKEMIIRMLLKHDANAKVKDVKGKTLL